MVKFRYIIALLLPLLLAANNAEKAGNLPEHLIFGMPSEPDQLINRRGFSLGYSHKYRQAVWVSYIITAETLNQKKVRRKNKFSVDPAIKLNPVKPRDYTRTGYDRGHLVPAADMTWSEETMKHSFYMSNISPQLPGCNRGIWKRLEEQTRHWTIQEGSLCIITGPIFSFPRGNLGTSNIPIPNGFYKIILDLTPPLKMIGFVIPNDASKKRLPSFVVQVDEIEAATQCDFFPDLPGAEEMEKNSNTRLWGW